MACHGRPATTSQPATTVAAVPRTRIPIQWESAPPDFRPVPTQRTFPPGKHPAEHRPARDASARATQICLSCHDGTIAKFIAAETLVDVHIAEHAQIDVQHDHPVGVPYPRIDRGYRPAIHVENAGVPLPGGRVECISCHDPHNAWGQPAMLVMSNRRSALCLTCHIK